MSIIAQSAQSGFSKAEEYDKYRPSYPYESIENLLKNLGVLAFNGARIIDLAAGTGKFTEILVSRTERYEIVAVEPHDEMRKILEKKNLERVRVIKGTAEDMSLLDSEWADAVIIAQAFHWFANMAALEEIHRTLQPGCVLGMIWNIEDYNSPVEWEATTKWEGELKELMWSNGDADPRFRHFVWQRVFDDQLRSTPATVQTADPIFSLPLGQHEVKWTDWLSKEDIWSRYSTISHISVLEGSQFNNIRRAVFQTMDGAEVQVNDEGKIALHGRTVSYWTTAIPSAPL